MLNAASEAHSPQADQRRGPQARPQSRLHRRSCAQRSLRWPPGGRGGPQRGSSASPHSAGRGRPGVGDTPPAAPPAPGRGRRPPAPAPPAHAPPHVRRAPSRRRAAAGGGSGPRFLRPGLRASSLPSPGPAAFGRRRRARRRPPAPAPPRAVPGGPAGAGSQRGVRPAAPPSEPVTGREFLRPSQPVAAGASAAGSAGSPAAPDPASGGGTDAPKSTLVAAFGSGTLPGPSRLHCFLPRSLPPPSPAFLPSPTPAARSAPCLRLAAPPCPLRTETSSSRAPRDP